MITQQTSLSLWNLTFSRRCSWRFEPSGPRKLRCWASTVRRFGRVMAHGVARDGEVKGKLAKGVGSQYSHTTSEHGVSSITIADAHTSAASSRLNWRPRRFKWTRPFGRKTKSGFCACATTFQTQSTFIFMVKHSKNNTSEEHTSC